ncbi:MAG: tetratricopeptide repeat protein [Lachnospiraceae bacterium]|nr:tetratricopeptide repeat protein [Lachnospiraceae bacterium]
MDYQIMEPDDYTEPRCLLNMKTGLKDVPAHSVPMGRILEKLDEYLGREDWNAAERHLDYWLQDALAGGDRKGALAIENERMGFFRKRGREQEAMEAVSHALSLIRELSMEDSITAATTCVNIATVYKTFSRADQSLPFFRQALPVYEADLKPDDPRLGGLYNNMALALADLDQFEEADSCYQKALSVMKQVPNGELEQAITLLNQADLKAARFGYEAAEEAIQDLLDKARTLLDTPSLPRNGYYAFVLTSCAPTFRLYGRFADADELEEIAEKIYKR